MSDMNPDFPMTPREELELKITDLLLGELPAEEAEALRRAMAQDVELAALHDRLKKTIVLVGETAGHPAEKPASEPAPLKLSAERREKLLQEFKMIRPTELDRPRRRESTSVVAVAAVAVLVLFVGAALLLPALSKAKSKSSSPRLALLHFSDSSTAPAASQPQVGNAVKNELAASSTVQEELAQEKGAQKTDIARRRLFYRGQEIALPSGGSKPNTIADLSDETQRVDEKRGFAVNGSENVTLGKSLQGQTKGVFGCCDGSVQRVALGWNR